LPYLDSRETTSPLSILRGWGGVQSRTVCENLTPVNI
jgi:hypothetical protein